MTDEKEQKKEADRSDYRPVARVKTESSEKNKTKMELSESR